MGFVNYVYKPRKGLEMCNVTIELKCENVSHEMIAAAMEEKFMKLVRRNDIRYAIWCMMDGLLEVIDTIDADELGFQGQVLNGRAQSPAEQTAVKCVKGLAYLRGGNLVYALEQYFTACHELELIPEEWDQVQTLFHHILK